METRPTVIDIDLLALEYNFKAIEKLVAPAQVMPIVKGNAYGHGIIACSKQLEKSGATILGVALLEEGILLRNAGIRLPIVVLGGILGQQIELFIAHNLDIVAASVFKLQAIEEQAKKMGKRARVHLEIDTGMERTGVHYYSAHTLIEAAAQAKHCDIVSVFSHFATAEEAEYSFAQVQLERFIQCMNLFEHYGLPIPQRHIAASGGIVQLPQSHLDLVRPGLLLYGVAPSIQINNVLKEKNITLKPVMSLRSRVVYFKIVKAGDGVSYGLTWKPMHDTRIVTVPLGYADGYLRSFAQHSHVLIGGKRYPIVGRICMDQFMVNIEQDSVYNNDEVTLIGSQGSETITLDELAAHQPDGNAREIMTLLSARIPRSYKNNE
jgi:alanine racemase